MKINGVATDTFFLLFQDNRDIPFRSCYSVQSVMSGNIILRSYLCAE